MRERLIFTKGSFKYCHASTIVATPEGLMMACFAGPAEGHRDTGIWGATFKDEWCEQKQIIDSMQENGQKQPLWNPVLFSWNQEIRLYYRMGASPSNWGCAYASTHDSKTWSLPEQLPPTLTGPVRNKPLLLKTGDIIVPTSTEEDGWKIHFEILKAGEENWQIVTVPDQGLKAIQPVILEHDNNTLQALCRTRNSYIAQTWSFDGGFTWSELELTSLINPGAGIDAIRCDEYGYLLVYNNCKFGRYKLEIAISRDGVEWENTFTLENSMGEYSYPSSVFSENGSLNIVYTLNRKNIKHVEFTKDEVAGFFQ